MFGNLLQDLDQAFVGVPCFHLAILRAASNTLLTVVNLQQCVFNVMQSVHFVDVPDPRIKLMILSSILITLKYTILATAICNLQVTQSNLRNNIE